MKNQQYINNLLSRLSAVTGVPATLGHVYTNDDYELQFLAHDVLPDENPSCVVLETYLITLWIPNAPYANCRPYDHQDGFLPSIAI